MKPVIAVCGLPGTGKSTVARFLSQLSGAKVLRTDAIRKSTFDEPTYTRVENARVYVELMHRAHIRVNQGTPVILDATFRKRWLRDEVRELIEQPLFVLVTCDAEQVYCRLENRDGLSDADIGVYESMSFEPIDGPFLEIDTTRAQLQHALQ